MLWVVNQVAELYSISESRTFEVLMKEVIMDNLPNQTDTNIVKIIHESFGSDNEGMTLRAKDADIEDMITVVSWWIFNVKKYVH